LGNDDDDDDDASEEPAAITIIIKEPIKKSKLVLILLSGRDIVISTMQLMLCGRNILQFCFCLVQDIASGQEEGFLR
jgi:hypothetical protein